MSAVFLGSILFVIKASMGWDFVGYYKKNATNSSENASNSSDSWFGSAYWFGSKRNHGSL